MDMRDSVRRDANPVRAFRRLMRQNFPDLEFAVADEARLYDLEGYCDDLVRAEGSVIFSAPLASRRR